MNISAIKDSIVSGAKSTGKAIGGAAVWCGHKISSGFNNYLVPAVSKAWDLMKTGASHAWDGIKYAGRHTAAFLRTGNGVGTVAIAAGIGLMAAQFHPAFRDDDKLLHRVAFLALGAFCIAGGALIIGLKGPTAII
jgi:hypothetical protein